MDQQKIYTYEDILLIKELLELNREVKLVVSGTSMRPFFYHQKTIVTLANPIEPFKRFDVVLYCHNGDYKLHRILKVHGDQLVICGDASVTLEYINVISVFGIVVYHQKGRYKTSANNKRYLKQVRFWNFLKPFRRYLIRLYKGD